MENYSKKKLHLGLDLGIASVGWSLVDENQNIIKCGSHLFKQLSVDNKNIEYGEKIRGEFRRARRRLNRFKQRKIDFLCMIDKFCLPNQEKKIKTNKFSTLYREEYQNIFGFNKSFTSTDFLFNNASNSNYKNIDLYEVYKKGFNQKLDPKELFLFLYWKLGIRGVFFKECDDLINKSDYNYEDSVCFKYYEPILKSSFSKIRSSENYKIKIPHSHHRKDIEIILNNQSQYYEDNFSNFIEDYLKIFDRHRDGQIGPWYDDNINKEKAQNLYSKLDAKQRRWIIEHDENGNSKYHYLWEKNIAECPISKIKNCNKTNFEIEKRCNQYFFIAEISNFLSQLASTKLNNEKLTVYQIKEIFKNIIKKCEAPTIESISKYLNSDVDNFTGYPKNKTQTSSNFDKLEKFLLIFDKKDGYVQNVDLLFEQNLMKIINDFDELSKLRFKLLKQYYIKVDDKNSKDKKITKNDSDLNFKNRNKNFNKSKQDAYEQINKLILDSKLTFIKINNINFDKFCNFENINEKDMSGTREYGYSVFYEYINNSINNLDNQKIDNFNIYYKDEIKEAKNQSFEKFLKINFNKSLQKESLSNQFIPNKLFDDIEFISPNVRNTIHETIRVINNEVLKFCYKNNEYELDAIILETTYGNDEINTSLLSNKQKKEEISKLQEFQENKNEEAKTELKKYNLSINELNIKKYNLWKEQHCFDAYDTNSRIEISEFNDCEVDHIIPRSISHDNTKANLVLTRAKNNQSKGQKTPVQWFKNDPDKLQNLKSKWKEWFNFKNKDKNKEYYKEKYNNLVTEELEYSRFFRRNLSETTYAIRKIKEGLLSFLEFRNNQIKNQEIKSEFIINNLRKIINCQIMTISGSESQNIRKLIDENWTKDRNISNHHAHDASIIAIYSSLDYIKEYHKKMNNLWTLKKKFEDRNEFNSWVKKLSFNRTNNLKEFIGKNKEDIKNKIVSDENFSYSCKPKKNKKMINWINKLLEKGEQEKAIELIKKVPTSQIFENQNFQTYKEIEKDKKRRVIKIDLTNSKDDSKFIKIYLDLLKETQKSNKSAKEIIEEYCRENNILSNYNVIFDLFQIIKEYPISENKEINFENTKNYDLFSKYLEYIKKEGISDDFINGIPITNCQKNNSNNDLKIKYIVKNIKKLLEDKYNPTYEFLKNYKFTNTKNGKKLFDESKFKLLNQRKCLYGNSTKFFILFKMNNRIYFAKINQLNFMIAKNIYYSLNELPSYIKLIKIFNLNQLFVLNNEIYETTNYNISNSIITIINRSRKEKNKKIEIEKSYNALDQEFKEKLKII